jgi:cyclopropane-fatty-acyl-phospholipid synthase
MYVYCPLIQAITMPDELYEEYIRSPGFIKEYIFPGGSLPSLSRIKSISASSGLRYILAQSIDV